MSNSTEMIVDKNLAKIHDSYRTSIQIVAIEHINQILNELNKWVQFDKMMFHCYWDGSFEDIHSFITVGEYLLSETKEADYLVLEDYDIRNSPYYDELDGSIEEFFGDDGVEIPSYLLNSANHYIQVIATDCCLFDVIITAKKDEEGKFKFNIQKANQGEFN